MFGVGWVPGLGLGSRLSVGGGGRRRRRAPCPVVVVAAAVCVSLRAGACGGGSARHGATGATVPDDVSSPTTPTSTTASTVPAIDITTKPPVVTVEYADAVMDEL